jgi:RNA polymerase sigma factor (sigma-70 family)
MELEIVQLPIQLSSFLVAPNSGPFLARFGSLCGDDPAISCVIAVEFQDLLGPAGPVQGNIGRQQARVDGEVAMSDGRLSGALRHLRGASLLREVGALTDGQLLERFLRDRDEAAFEALVHRHGPMVLGVCRRLLGDAHDADDAFQATFLVLVHKAASVVPRELVGHWLHGVALRTALKARRLAFRRRAREMLVAKMPERETVDSEPMHDLRALLDRELSRLPEAYRIPVVLCELTGKTKKEAAQQLGVPEGTVSSRLVRGRGLLRQRLARQGLALSTAALGAALAESNASAVVPAEMLRATVKAGLVGMPGRAAAAQEVSGPVAALLKVVLRELFIAKLRKVARIAAAVAAVALVSFAAGYVAHRTWSDSPPDALETKAPYHATPGKIEVPEDSVPPEPVPLDGDLPAGGLHPLGLVNVNGTLYFSGGSGNGKELWKSTPMAKGPPLTELVKRIMIKPTGYSNPAHLTKVGPTVFFTADDGVHKRQLWKSDGTDQGTVMVKDINGSRLDAFPTGAENLIAVGQTLFFIANDGKKGDELWKSNGTEVGTVVVRHVYATYSAAMGSPRAMVNMNGTLFFVANDMKHGWELWKSDGTEAGTVMVKDINPDGGNSFPCFLTNVNGTLFFTAEDGKHGRQLWKSDGTAAGTVMVKAIDSVVRPDRPDLRGAFPYAFVGHLTAVGKTLYFVAEEGKNGRHLWKSDGTEAGTVVVADVYPGRKNAQFPDLPALAAVNGTLYFAGDDGVHGRQLWRTDGTGLGTRMVKVIAPGGKDADSKPGALTDVHGTLYFSATDGVHCRKLWKSDGTEAGTVPINRDFFPDTEPQKGTEWPMNLTVVNDTLFFVADWRDLKRAPGQPYGGVDLWYMSVPKRRSP